MKWEESELIIVLSVSRYHLQRPACCHGCGAQLEAGERHTSVGVIDRREGTKHRWYLCEGCRVFFEYPTPEDAPPFVQEFLFENRMAREIWNTWE